MPPEVLAREEYVPAKYDVFSAGVILFTLYSGFPPFKSAAKDDPNYKEIISGNFDKFWADIVKERRKKPDFYPKEFQELVNSMLHHNPSERATLKTIVESAWYKNEEISTIEEVRELFEKRNLKIIEQPLVLVTDQPDSLANEEEKEIATSAPSRVQTRRSVDD